MSQSKPVTETAILYLKQGVTLEDAWAGIGTTGEAFKVFGDTLQKQKGYIRQYWGQQIENPNVFVQTIDWESFEAHAAFINSEEYKPFLANASQLFDFEAAAPLMSHTTFTSDATAARAAPVTEVAFFMLPKEASEEEKSRLEDLALGVVKVGSTAGKATASAIGWVFEDQPHSQAPNGQAIALNILVGWPSHEDHIECTQTPAFKDATQGLSDVVLQCTPERPYFFHAKFRERV